MTLILSSHDDNYPGDPTYTLYDSVTVTTGSGGGSGGGGITNGGFETGTLSGRTSSGAHTGVSTTDNTKGSRRSFVAKTCASVYAWTLATASVTAGLSDPLSPTSHDDNYSGDPTYTLFDDSP